MMYKIWCLSPNMYLHRWCSKAIQLCQVDGPEGSCQCPGCSQPMLFEHSDYNPSIPGVPWLEMAKSHLRQPRVAHQIHPNTSGKKEKYFWYNSAWYLCPCGVFDVTSSTFATFDECLGHWDLAAWSQVPGNRGSWKGFYGVPRLDVPLQQASAWTWAKTLVPWWTPKYCSGM